jgi:hypothetical protein
MSVSLNDWVENHWLVPHEATAEETRDLLYIVDRDIKTAQTPGVHPDWRLSIAWNAILQAAACALAAAGFRATRESHHYRTIQSLALTVGVDAVMLARLDRFRKKRNVGDYEKAGMVSDEEADELVRLAEGIRRRVLEWLAAKHADLLRDGDV